MDENEKNKFQVVSSYNDFNEKNYTKSNFSFSKSILLPFVSAVVGCSLVIGVCFNTPSIKQTLLGSSNSNTQVETSNKTSLDEHSSGTVSQISLSAYSDTAVFAANKILPSIVGIEIEYNVTSSFSFFGGSQSTSTATASGSGIIISTDGYILTNNHVVDTSTSNSSYSYYTLSEAKSVKVKLYNDDTLYDAEIIGKDSKTDLAVLKINKTDLTVAEFADSDSVKIGEFAMAVGNPLGLESSITCGVVSAVNRQVQSSDGTSYTCIQTDAAINSGNSGGALVNSEGKVIGVNTLKLSGTGVEGIGFAIPINSTIDITSSLIENKKVLRPYIGISIIELDEQTAKENNLVQGIYIKGIEDFSAGEKAGLKIGDVIIKADGKEVTTQAELDSIKDTHQIGDTLTLTINRNGKEKEIKVILGEAP